MYERLSAYDYKHEVDSHVTKCSVGSFKEIVNNNPQLQLFSLDVDRKTDASTDRGTMYRQKSLLLTAFHVL